MAAVLVVDDEGNIRRMVGRLLEAEGHRVREAADGREALRAVAEEAPDVVLLDLAMPGPGGLEVLAELRRDHAGIPVIMMSGQATLSDAVRATKLGAFHFIEKPLSPEAVLLTLSGALELSRTRALQRALSEELGHDGRLVGSSEPMARLRRTIAQVAPTEARVLLTGESGTGKELAAAALHAGSSRAAGPFVRVNSAAIPRELVESEMFGHEKGAFTGAHERRLGRFELAHGGTLFLDEVGDLGAEAQAKLLRALETGEVERVGARAPVRVDVRVIAATNRDLQEDARTGRFRADLFYRLHVVPIHLPPLRERISDVPELVEHFLARLQARNGMPRPRLGREALDRLKAYDWPGNVRELANVCERLAILHPGGDIGAADLARVLPGAGAGDAAADDDAPLADRLDAYERRLIERAIERADGNVAEAARRLSTDRPNLYRRMRRLHIDRSPPES